jgi:hypothetical protein
MTRYRSSSIAVAVLLLLLVSSSSSVEAALIAKTPVSSALDYRGQEVTPLEPWEEAVDGFGDRGCYKITG